ncbi:methyltransferase domain-containing protein [Salinispora tropica]|uniref:methyltransferase domain-containing protein n=1 Tax=Salinispora tropica TaxID=168695 RepID=UPI00048F6FDF|nr:methyltransferase domain-containing protein [Salinispora tropica]
MSDRTFPPIERRCDVAVIGGSAAGLAAALQLAGQRRSVIVIDDGASRDAPAERLHGYLGREGVPPAEILATGREEARSYGVEVLTGHVERITRMPDGRFRAELASGHSIIARRALAAIGLVDELPDIGDLDQHWGRDVIHSPFGRGFEVRDGRIVQIVTHPGGLRTTELFRHLSAQLTVVLHGDVPVEEAEVDVLRASGVAVVPGFVTGLTTNDVGRIEAVRLANHDDIDADTVVVTPRFHVRAEPFAPLGLQPASHPTGLGRFLETDATGATAVPGLYAAGNATDTSQQLLQAAAHGSQVGAAISWSLAHDDSRATAQPPSNQADWDHRYSSDQIWSGNPNGTLVHEVTGLTPRRALDVGAGEGADALWLAEQGWKVTASDISPRALDHVSAVARHRGLPVECHRADANALDAFESAAFELVSAQYASIPRTPDGRGIHNLLNAVAPGGTLLVVSHDRAPSRTSLDSAHMPPFDPDAYLRVDDFATALAGSVGWDIEVHDKRLRPPGAASASHHVHDVVLRARRTTAGDPGRGLLGGDHLGAS